MYRNTAASGNPLLLPLARLIVILYAGPFVWVCLFLFYVVCEYVGTAVAACQHLQHVFTINRMSESFMCVSDN